jgi:hypothetical protein
MERDRHESTVAPDSGSRGVIMIYQVPISDLIDELQVASQHIGLRAEDIASLLDAGVTVTELLDYLEAAMSHRLD